MSMRIGNIRFQFEPRSFMQPNGRDLWHEEAKRNTLENKSAKRVTSNEDTKNAASAKKRQNVALGRRLTSRTEADAKKAEEAAGKNETSRARVKVDEKAAGSANGIKPADI